MGQVRGDGFGAHAEILEDEDSEIDEEQEEDDYNRQSQPTPLRP